MPRRPMTEEQKRKKRERERERQNGTPVIAQTWWKKLLHKFFSWTLNRQSRSVTSRAIVRVPKGGGGGEGPWNPGFFCCGGPEPDHFSAWSPGRF